MSSKQTTAMSSGTRRPWARIAWMAPTATRLLTAKMAVAPVGALQEGAGRFVAARGVGRWPFDDEGRVEGEAGGGEGVLVAAEAVAGGGDGLGTR